jgi:hypothetical protein
LVHHTGNNEDNKGRARGSSAWRGALDGEHSVSRSQTDDSVITIAQKKSKDAEMLPDVHCALLKVEIPGWIDEDGLPVSSAVMISEQAPAARSKGDKVTEGHRATFERAWWASGAETRQGAPYVSRSGLEAFLCKPEGGGLKASSAAQVTKTSNPGGLVGRLMTAGYLAAHEHGWIVCDPDHATALTIARS